ncbi:uncharacterized protein DFL_005942 [Arthrobotrys flagrans]|uniref:Uncharacterized protein n=1 Tax=Arthrobotrys flagrans TaxID=97331 RepID=A0A436ZYU8_ARTFL|nr:hypothetical protein DFL_005942 [Arthrobotrys flagrans]
MRLGFTQGSEGTFLSRPQSPSKLPSRTTRRKKRLNDRPKDLIRSPSRSFRGSTVAVPLSPEIRGKPRYDRQLSPRAENFVPSQDLPVVKSEPEQAGKELVKFEQKAGEKVQESAAVTKKEVFKSRTLYILHHAYDVGAEYEDVHQLYARGYGGEENADEEVVNSIPKDVQNLLTEKFEQRDSVAGGINGSGILKNGKLNERMKRLMNEFVAEAKKFLPRRANQVTLSLREQPDWKAIQQRDIKFSQGLHRHLEELREHQAKFRRETKKILDEMTGQRTVMFVKCSSNSDIILGSAMVVVDEVEGHMANLFKREDNLKSDEKCKNLDLEANIEIAMKGPGALNLGLIDSEDDDGGVKLSPEEARSWF